ncbi:MAG: hypothetical protein H0U03_07190 [Actinobacteria bacterium]|nr:hypothetical protein [Actinomycetota bacterium]
MPGFLLINPRSGEEQPSAEELVRAADELGVATHVLAAGEDAGRLASEADAEILGMAGGDGSLAAVADAAARSGRAFVCIPFGTRNHFARDLGLDRADPIGALRAFDGEERRIDVGRVGERLFLNNVSLGVYAGLVHRREHHRRRRQALAGMRAVWLSLADRHPTGFLVDGQPVTARIVLVANNSYSLELFSVGERDTLDAGMLHLYTAEGWFPGSWDDRSGTGFTVDSRDHRLRAAIDGEPVELETPVEFSIEPRALRVLLPRAPD